MKKFKITKGNRVYIVDAKSHIDAISKVNSVKTDGVRDSISQWKPGMSEIGLFQISYKKGTVNQSILVKAATKEDAINKFTKHEPDAEVFGVNEYPNPHFGEPILDSSIKDEWSGVRSNGVIFNYSDGKYTITHKNGKVETFPGNKFNTAEELFKYIDNIKDSAIKDMPLMFKSNVNMQSLKSNIDNVKNKPNETYINSLNANVQGIIADIEEIKGYEKEGKFNESPALKFSCKNLTAQYYKLLNDPKLQGTLHKLDVPTYKNVLYAEHQAQMLSQVTLKDSDIKDEDYSKYLSIVKQLEKLVEPANRELQQKIAKYGVTKQDIRNNSPKYRDVCREIPELKVWAKLIMQLPGELAGSMPAHPSQESVDKLKKAVTNSKAFDSTIK